MTREDNMNDIINKELRKGLESLNVITDELHEVDCTIYENLNNFDQLEYIWPYYNNDTEAMLPCTCVKVNRLIQNKKNLGFYDLRVVMFFFNCIDRHTAEHILKSWIAMDHDGHDDSLSMDIRNLVIKHDLYNHKILEKFIGIYNKSRSYLNLNNIRYIVENSDNDLDKTYEALSKSSPAVASLLLLKNNLNEKYQLKGLKALSKINSSRSINAQLDFNLLEKLGPKSRLDAMRHLIAIGRLYSKNQNYLPFKTIPDKDELGKLLFPCSLKYNDEVTKLINDFEHIVKQHNKNRLENKLRENNGN